MKKKLDISLKKLAKDFCEYGKTKCGICGRKLVKIRGKYPHDPKRKVCPDCLQSRIDQIAEIVDRNYGIAYTAKKEL